VTVFGQRILRIGESPEGVGGASALGGERRRCEIGDAAHTGEAPLKDFEQKERPPPPPRGESGTPTDTQVKYV